MMWHTRMITRMMWKVNELRGFAKVKGKREERKILLTDNWHTYFADGTNELDLQMGGSSFTLGYNNPDVVKGLEVQMLETARCQSNNHNYNDATVEAGKILCDGVWDTYTWALSGTSAVEAAISMNDEYWKVKGEKRHKIISFSFAWHGTSYLTKDMGAPFLLANHTKRWINMPHPKGTFAEELEITTKIREMDLSKVGCIIFDSATWINGLHGFSQTWWSTIKSICYEHGILMITDDVASCWGKTGSLHPYKTLGYGMQPDISAVGKSLTAGYAPLGAAVCNKKVGEVIREPGAWNYNHTWQPSMMGIYIMLNVHKYITEHKLLEEVPEIETQLMRIADELDIDSYRVQGCFFALDAKKETKHTGLSSTILKNNIRGCAPLTANYKYFEDLRTHLNGHIS